jgi:alkanesulfonate monooxygenase SsuD/methylene tetrahydromethanopterin reductase-like flavin-dependent oxidoreductase (luciferase family)
MTVKVGNEHGVVPAAFVPSADLGRPYVSVSADVVVAEDEATARELATGYGLWVRSIRSGEGAIAFPAPEQARAYDWTAADRAMVADRVDTRFVGSAAQVAGRLEQLQEATGADELIITTITHEHADRVRSYRLLAEEWHRRWRVLCAGLSTSSISSPAAPSPDWLIAERFPSHSL